MNQFRSVLFWLHLAAGVIAGSVVLIMSITGVALTYEKQMLEWADRRAWSVPPSVGAERLSPETLLARVREARPEAVPTTLTLRADPTAPVTVAFEGDSPLLVDPYRGAVIGRPPAALRAFFRTMTNWHRWLALEGASRPLGKALTGAANLAFLFIVLSGICLWVPRIWTWVQFKKVLWFRRGLPGKARDFNWHNVIGIWSAVPLAIVVAGAVPISYPWAGNLVYRLAGEVPPHASSSPRGPGGPGGPGTPGAPGEPGGRGRARGEAGRREPRPAISLAGFDERFATASQQISGWRAMTVRLPQGAQQPYVFTIDEGYGGQPQKRGTLTVNQSSGAVEKWETFADQSPGRRLRTWFRFAHTGEYYGLAGQTIAGVVSAGGVVLVWTGVALAWRRFTGWISGRQQARRDADRKQAA
jgi:uncharacterized iron-regulated membrane protein